MAAALAGAAMLPLAAQAQADLNGRVGKLEGEMRAVQRKVFPSGAGQIVEPELSERAAPAAIPALKARVRTLRIAACRALAARALDCGDAAEVRALIGETG